METYLEKWRICTELNTILEWEETLEKVVWEKMEVLFFLFLMGFHADFEGIAPDVRGADEGWDDLHQGGLVDRCIDGRS